MLLQDCLYSILTSRQDHDREQHKGVKEMMYKLGMSVSVC